MTAGDGVGSVVMFIRAFMIYEAVGLVVGACGLCGLHHDLPSTYPARSQHLQQESLGCDGRRLSV